MAGSGRRDGRLYEQVAWPLGKIYGHPYDAFKLALNEQETFFTSLANPPSPATIAALTSTIARRLTPQPIKLRADIELMCYTPAGIDAIKKGAQGGREREQRDGADQGQVGRAPVVRIEYERDEQGEPSRMPHTCSTCNNGLFAPSGPWSGRQSCRECREGA
ncbi:hypothetical protein OG21DRAFT_1513085 [Imleria badia]|nr:hypothetical protein OG21DRAFT_1513085 [Imleria badia]